MISKKFSKSYDDALTQSYLFHSEFVNDKSLFTAFSPVFTDPYAVDFLDLITIADDFPTNNEDLNNQVILSTQVEETMELARAHYQKLLFYIGIAFSKSETTLLAFGNNLYDKARKLPQKMTNLLQNAYSNANSTTYKASLIAAGFVQTEINLLKSLEEDVTEKYNAQQNYIQHSFKRTEDRTVAFNNVWDEMVKISNASKLIFKDSPAKIEFYLLYPETGGGGGTLTAVANFAYSWSETDFTWDAVVNATSYQIEESADQVTWTEIYAGEYNNFSFTPSVSGTLYYRCRARNSGGYGDFSATISIEFLNVLPAPQNLQVAATGPSGLDLQLTWDAVPTATSYWPYRSVVALGAPAGSFSYQGINVPTSSWVQTVEAGHRYYYKIKGVNPIKQGGFSDIVFVDVV